MTTANKRTRAPESQTDWNRLRSMTDADIERAVADDPDAAAVPTVEEMKEYKPVPARARR